MSTGNSQGVSPVLSENGSRRISLVAYLGWLTLGLGPLLYLGQIKASLLWTPWYIPGLATLGAVLLGLCCWWQPTWWRRVNFGLAAVLGGLIWFVLAVGNRTPQYAGPIAVGQSVPPFSAKLSDGTSWSHVELANGGPMLLTFFRGRW